ncbi:lipid-A-disaccharide synthase [Candidatus Bathyarchaeota archaeon]|nr:MAG: lipid-A-disaccharide synthase [Candidatus Bathyarchaeota archaeon]
MRIIIDILTPKQCMLFLKLSEKLRRNGHTVFNVSREYRDVVNLLKLKGLKAKIIGKHGGKELASKLKASAHRIIDLATYFEEVDPDIAVSFSSPEMARVSFGLGVPHICINDSPHAEAVARLTIPLSAKLLTPKMIPRQAWTRYGISQERIKQYNALDPWAWLKDFTPDENVLSELGLSRSKPILTFRPEEEFAAYLAGKTQGKTGVIPVIEQVLAERDDVQIVAIPRYTEQLEVLRESFQDRIIVSHSSIDGPSLLYYTTIFIGGGGTMTTEAALLGVPTFSFYPSEPFIVLKYLIRKGFVKLVRDPNELAMKILETLDNIKDEKRKQRERAERLVETFEDPIQVITAEIEKTV